LPDNYSGSVIDNQQPSVKLTSSSPKEHAEVFFLFHLFLLYARNLYALITHTNRNKNELDRDQTSSSHSLAVSPKTDSQVLFFKTHKIKKKKKKKNERTRLREIKRVIQNKVAYLLVTSFSFLSSVAFEECTADFSFFCRRTQKVNNTKKGLG
jgi:hypothetical protein